MKYVVDSSVAFKWSIKEAAIHELHAPDFYPVELAHAITRAERQQRLTQAE